MLLLSALSAGCSADDQTAALTVSEDETVVRVFGTRPSWDVEDMVKRSDAVVVGMISSELGEKQQPGVGEPPKLYYNYRDYEFTVEEVLYSNTDLPTRIAILIEDGASGVDGSRVVGMEDLPTLQANERILLFLESLDAPKFSGGVGRPVPTGFTETTYFQVIIGSRFAKMLREGDEWKDARNGQKFTVGQLANAIERQNR